MGAVFAIATAVALPPRAMRAGVILAQVFPSSFQVDIALISDLGSFSQSVFVPLRASARFPAGSAHVAELGSTHARLRQGVLVHEAAAR